MTVIEAYNRLRSGAQHRLEDATRPFRVLVRLGQCSVALGASEVMGAFEEDLTDNASLVVAGCDGACHSAPSVMVTTAAGESVQLPDIDRDIAIRIATVLEADKAPLRFQDDQPAFFDSQDRVVLRDCGAMDAEGIDEYLASGGYQGLGLALSQTAVDVTDAVKQSGLRGRGGAYFPAASKWEAARRASEEPRYLVVNSEEGEPGLFKDRHLMEGMPHRVLEGALIAAYATGASSVHIYINAEADLSAARMAGAVGAATKLGIIGSDVLGSGWSVDVSIHRGAGGYVCGEETTLLNTMEGRRREPRLRPPFPTESGLGSRPTVINNAETLSNLPFIMIEGPEAFARLGAEGATGTKVLSLSGAVNRPGLVEVPFGTSLLTVVEDIGGGVRDGSELVALGVGGPSSGLLPPGALDTRVMPGMLHESGVMLGAGGVIALDGSIGVLEAVRALAAYNADESCGKCTPCREGTPRMVEALDRIALDGATAVDIEELSLLADVVASASLCGLGQAAGGPITSALHFFPDEMGTK